MHHLDWYNKQKEKREENNRRNDIFLINQDLKRILQAIQSFINRKDYEKEAETLQRHVPHSSIWDVGYRNNMESEKVAIAQAILIQIILSKEKEIPRGKAMETEVEIQLKRLWNIEMGLFSQYRREKERLIREK